MLFEPVYDVGGRLWNRTLSCSIKSSDINTVNPFTDTPCQEEPPVLEYYYILSNN